MATELWVDVNITNRIMKSRKKVHNFSWISLIIEIYKKCVIYMTVNISLSEYVTLLENEFSRKFTNNYNFLRDIDNLRTLNCILESHGVYKGQVNLVYLLSKIITSEILKNRLKPKYEFTKETILKYGKNHDIKFPNIFFNKIIITISDKPTSYLSKDNYKDGYLNEVIINLDNSNSKEPLNDFKTLAIIFYHELLHAYESWKRFTSKAESLNKARERMNYDDLIAIFDKTPNSEDEAIENLMKYLLYMYNNIERNAFITEIHAILLDSKHNKKLLSYKAAIEEFKQSQEWQAIEYGLKNIVSDENRIKDKLIEKYIKVTKQDISKEKATKKIISLLEKCKSKFEELAPKAYFEYIENYNKEYLDEDYNGMLMTGNPNKISMDIVNLRFENFDEFF